MLRRILPPEPIAVSADWSRRTATFSALLGLIAVLVGRSGVVGGLGGVAVLGAALLAAVLAIGLAVRAAVVIWQTGQRGVGRALAGCALALLVLAYPAYLAIEAAQLPAIADISTDLASPPAFSTSPAARAARSGMMHGEPASATREAQRSAYPAVQPAMLDLDANEAYDLVLKLLAARHWRVVEAVPPRGRLGTGHVDAVARSRVMGFPEDVTIRIRPQAGQTRVDMRSASRIERHDIGANAARVASFVDDLENAE